ncbi:hypothetical protein DEU56DRAFT_757429 [Suillus clintonianus]|uniref:uncharacterized protein n=1 Tax=Suillus clintonianus TaxID=1904413 RepID=UPI001B87C16E|nr:uncharacterized protein DEU56DRAFT_757429 [Suillus clintonianus]KAG2132088.1 hypothetical protein DEU56DRAFT_757429 [Suillus clintonianus]
MFSPQPSIAALKAFVTVLLLPQFHYPSTMHAHTMHNRYGSTSNSLLAPPNAQEDILSGGKARMPGSKATSKPNIPSLPKPHYRRTPKAPRPDVHAFLPPPPYSASFLAVPNNTPATTPPLPPLSSSSSSDDSVTLSTPNAFAGVSSHGRSGLVGLGFEGLEKGGGGTFDGLGRLSDGFRLSDSSPPNQVRSKAVRTQPKKRHDVFFPCPHHSRSLSPVSFLARALPNTAMMQFRIHRRNDAGSPTPDMKIDPSRSTVSTELKRAAGMERRASLSRCERVGWR